MRTNELRVVAALAIAVAGGCIGNPDLVVTPATGTGTSPSDYCRRDAARLLLVEVRNQGDDDAPATVTRVTAPALGAHEVAVPTPPLAAGASAMLPPVDMLNCLSPACSFIIRVDADGAVAEASESNNESTGACPP